MYDAKFPLLSQCKEATSAHHKAMENVTSEQKAAQPPPHSGLEQDATGDEGASKLEGRCQAERGDRQERYSDKIGSSSCSSTQRTNEEEHIHSLLRERGESFPGGPTPYGRDQQGGGNGNPWHYSIPGCR